jgi:hypothetical protein
MASGTVTIHFTPLVIDLEDYDELIGERLAGNDVVGLASKDEVIHAINDMLQEGDFDEDISNALANERLINKIEVSDDFSIEGIQPDEEESK